MNARRTMICAAVLAACGTPRDHCERVKCDPGRACDVATGACQPIPGWDGEGGGSGGGSGDGGTDAGTDCAPPCQGGQVCDRPARQCVQCLDDSHCACPNPVCNRTTKTCGPPAEPGDPGAGEDCDSAGAVPLQACATRAVWTVDTSARSGDSSGACGGEGRDAVFRFTLAQTRDVLVSIAHGPGVEPVVYVRRAPCSDGAELVCRDFGSASGQLRLKSAPAGEYFLFVDAYAPGTAGPTQVTVDVLPPTLPANETCATAEPLAFSDGGASVRVSVDTSAALDDHAGRCNNLPGSGEAVYRLSLSSARDVRVTSRGADPVLYLRPDPCRVATDLACNRGSRGGLELFNLAAGEYFLFVEGLAADGGTPGPTDVTVALSGPTPPPPNDVCAGARLVALPAGPSTVTHRVDLRLALDDYDSEVCTATEPSNDVVFQLSVPSTKTVDISARVPDGGTADPILFLREGPCATGTELDCDDQVTPAPERIVRTLGAGTYYLFVDTYLPEAAGPVDVTFSSD